MKKYIFMRINTMRSNKYSVKRIISLFCIMSVIAAISGQSVSAMFSSSYMDTGNVEISVNTIDSLRQISPYIYGINTEAGASGVSVNAIKQSDPRVSSYNWETNFANSGSGNGSENGLFLVDSYPQNRWTSPALYTENLIARAERYGIPSRYVTLQMMGKVAPAASGEPWETVLFNKNDSYLSSPDTTDGIVYMDEYVSFLANKYNYAIDGGINGYFLDNEPENWSSRFPEAVPSPITAEDLVSRSSELALTVKNIDPTALVYGPSVSGIGSFINIKNPSDWEQHSSEYSWFIDYYLAEMKKASDRQNARLLDVLDVHYHTEATNGLLQPIISSSDSISNNTRLQAPRILWDSSYTENSTTAITYNQHIPLIPTLKASIDMYYPGTKLSFSEYNFGGGNNISGGIAVADTLGIFASYGVHMACLKPNSTDISYMKSAINIYTDYDGYGSGFGNTLVRSSNGGDAMSSVYASVNGNDESTLKTVIINKNSSKSKTAEISITSGSEFSGAQVYYFNEENSDIMRADDIENIENNSFTFEMEPLSVYILVFSDQAAEELQEDTDLFPTENNETSVSTTTAEEKPAIVTASVFIPEHVDASTYSQAGTSASVQEDSTETSVSQVSDVPAGSASDSKISVYTEESGEAVFIDNEHESKVPPAVKAVVSMLVAAVVLALFYIPIADHISLRKKLR